MRLDIRTLVIILCLSTTLQFISLFFLNRSRMKYNGLSCWLMASGFWALGFFSNFIRDFPGIGPFAIFANNALFVAGLALIYVGVHRFFNRTTRYSLLVTLCLTVTLFAAYFTFVDNNIAARRVNFSFGTGLMSLLVARALYQHRMNAVITSARFLMMVFLLNGLFLVFRGITPFIDPEIGGVFSATLTQTATYLVAFIASTLWTFGFIIMTSQRLAEENREARNNAEDALAHERQMLLEQRQFLSMISHEFRTPLAVADFAAANFSEVPPLDQEEIDRRAAQIRRATRSMTKLIDNCMTSERIEMGGFVLSRLEADIASLILETAQLVNFSQKHTFQIICDEAVSTWNLDPTLIRIALSNLIDNAVKYSDGGTVTLNVQTQANELCFAVINKGHGIQADEARRLFQKFVRGSAANRGKGIRGSGLGLFISQRIAQAHGGDVRLVTEREGVTVFELRIGA